MSISLLKNEMNQIPFSYFEKVECGNMLHYRLVDCLNTLKQPQFLRFIKLCKNVISTVRYLLFEQYYVTFNGKAKSLFLYSSAYGDRNDLLNNFKSVTNLFNDTVIVYAVNSRKPSFHRVICMKPLRSWLKSINSINVDSISRINILMGLLKVYADYLEIHSKCSLEDIDRLITFCDVHPSEYFFTHMFNSAAKTTITLQHGVYSSYVNDWVFRGSQSDYLLGYGQFTIDEAKLVESYQGKVIPVGSMSFIDSEEECIPDRIEFKTIGLILDGEDGVGLRESNIELIDFIQAYCKSRNLNLFIKLHPTSSITDYSSIIDKSIVQKVYSKDITIAEFLKFIDIAIVRNSTCLIESLHYWKPSYIYNRPSQIVDVYHNVKELKFSTEASLDKVMTESNTNEVLHLISKYRNYFCLEDNSRNCYLNELNKLGVS